MRRFGIGEKIAALGVATAGVVLLLASLGLLVTEKRSFERELRRERGELAVVTASNLTAALAFGDAVTAQENADAVGQLPDVLRVSVLDEAGGVVASYERGDARRPKAHEDVTVSAPVTLEGEALGTVRIESTLERLDEAMARTVGVLGMVFLIGGACACLMSWLATRALVRPIRALAATMDHVRRHKDYRARADGGSRDEIGELADGFNAMVAEVARRDDSLEATVRERTEKLRASMERAEAATRTKSAFLANMSHEIRTPMNGVIGMAEMLRETELDRRQAELAEVIMSSGASLLTIINDILDFSKLEAGKFTLSEDVFDLRRVVEDVTALMSGAASEKGLELIVRYEPDLPRRFRGDGARLRQVITNLIGNAVKFTEAGEVLVDVEGERTSGGTVALRIAVHDTGCGIADDKLAHVFEDFEQADTSSSRAYEGTGLGLTISRSIVQLMGGTVDATSELGVGSCFVVRLDLPPAADDRAGPDPRTEGLGGAVVLHVGHNETSRRVLCEQLGSWRVEAHAAASAREGLSWLDDRLAAGAAAPSAVIIDFDLPRAEGATLALALRSRADFGRTPIVMLSRQGGQKGQGGQGAGEALEQAEWLTKPVRADRLAEVLSADLTGRGGKAGPDRSGGAAVIRAREPAAREAEAAAQPLAAARPLRLLIAEDNLVNRMVITSMLAGQPIEIEVAEDGASAVEKHASFNPDIVIMDVSMPGMDGLDATRAIRAREGRDGSSRTPIIGATAHVMAEDRERCMRAGMDDYMSKPIRKELVLEKLDHWGRARAA